MTIDIRGSDVMFAAADALNRGAQAAHGIYAREYEAARVSQVNRQLSYLERAYQEYDAALQQRTFVTTVEGEQGRHLTGQRFGQIDPGTLETDLDEFYQEQLQYITENTPNRAAREEMIQHLTMKHIQNRGVVMSQWQRAAEREDRAALQELTETVMSSNIPWEEKVSRIRTRVDEMVSVGRMWSDDAELFMTDVETQAQNAFAYAGAMDAMKAARSAEAGAMWLEENTPFYDGNPQARQSVLAAVRQEYDRFTREYDEARDREFADLHIRAATVDDVTQALDLLTETPMYDGDRKYTWEQRFRNKLSLLVRLDDLPSGVSLDDWQKGIESQVEAELALAKMDGQPMGELQRILNDSYYAENFAGRMEYRLSGDFVRRMEQYLQDDHDPFYEEGLRLIRDSGMDSEPQAQAIGDFMIWFRNHPEATENDIITAAGNIASGRLRSYTDNLLSMTWQWIRGEENTLDDLEKMTRDVHLGYGFGLTEARADWFTTLRDMQQERAAQEYPMVNIATSYIDTRGEWGLEAGTPVLVGADGTPYVYMPEEKTLTLYGLERTDDGGYRWERIEKQREQGSTAPPVINPGAAVRSPTISAGEQTDDPQVVAPMREQMLALRDNAYTSERDRATLERLIARADTGTLSGSEDLQLRTITARTEAAAQRAGATTADGAPGSGSEAAAERTARLETLRRVSESLLLTSDEQTRLNGLRQLYEQGGILAPLDDVFVQRMRMKADITELIAIATGENKRVLEAIRDRLFAGNLRIADMPTYERIAKELQ